ncbi:MAG TPA: hypothetical protein VFZ78_06225, partial [Flavisolibacter sp.]
MHLCTILSSLLLVCTGLNAQQPARTETREVFLPVDSVFVSNDTVYAVFAGGKDLGVREGLLVKTYSRWRSGVSNFAETGFGWVRNSGARKSVCAVEPYRKNSLPSKNDLVAVRLDVPLLPYRSIFSELAFLNVEFGDAYRTPLYSLRDIWSHDSPAREDSILRVVMNDIRDTYEWVKDDSTQPDTLKKPLIGSRFSGKTVLEVMRDIDREALMGYLIFVKHFPGKYIGQNFKANETFATWV